MSRVFICLWDCSIITAEPSLYGLLQHTRVLCYRKGTNSWANHPGDTDENITKCTMVVKNLNRGTSAGVCSLILPLTSLVTQGSYLTTLYFPHQYLTGIVTSRSQKVSEN